MTMSGLMLSVKRRGGKLDMNTFVEKLISPIDGKLTAIVDKNIALFDNSAGATGAEGE